MTLGRGQSEGYFGMGKWTGWAAGTSLPTEGTELQRVRKPSTLSSQRYLFPV